MKATKKQLQIIKRYYQLFREVEAQYYAEMGILEVRIEKATGIKGIEFFFCDNEFAGIGNADRTLDLIHREELE